METMNIIMVIIGILTTLVAMLLGWQFVYFVNYKREVKSLIKKNIRDLDTFYRSEIEDIKKDIVKNELNIGAAISQLYGQSCNDKEFGLIRFFGLSEFIEKYKKHIDPYDLTYLLRSVKIYNIDVQTSLKDLEDFREIVAKLDFGIEEKRCLLKSIDYYISEKAKSE